MYVNASFYHSRFGNFVIQSEDGDEVLTGNGLPIAPDYVINWGASFRPTPSVDATRQHQEHQRRRGQPGEHL